MIRWRFLALATLVCLVFAASAVAVSIWVVKHQWQQKKTQAASGTPEDDKPRKPEDKPTPEVKNGGESANGGQRSAAAERGEKALLGRAFIPGNWSQKGYQDAWKRWGGNLQKPPDRYAEAFRKYYGLHPAPYANGDLPMGLRQTPTGLFGKESLALDCLLCHGGSVAGKSYVGLGNATSDLQSLFEDLNGATGLPARTPFVFANVRGTSEAGSMSVYLLSKRGPDLSFGGGKDLGVREHLCEDVPAWWLLKKKKTMYHTGGSDARSVRSIMQFMMGSINGPSAFHDAEPAFRDIQAYLLSLQPPKYPFAIDKDLAGKGEALFTQHCAKCHGTYGEDWTYPNKIVPIDFIGTDRTRYDGISKEFGDYYNTSWFAREDGDNYPARETAGYQAPPLDGIWATAPYFHNGSVPTLYHVLNSKARPKIYTRSFRTGKEDYDPKYVGWKVQLLNQGANPNLPGIERRKVYDTTQPGRGNAGHTFGDRLTEEERLAVIEYLKTL